MYSTLDKKKRGCFIATFVLALAGVTGIGIGDAEFSIGKAFLLP